MGRPISLRCLASLAAVLCAIQTAEAGVVAAGSLNSCTADGSTPETSLQCDKKLVVTLELANNKKYETERLDFDVSCVNSPTNQCPCPCDYTTDVGCTCRNLAQKLSIGITKSAVYASYPLTYVKRFNGRPYEGIITTSGGTCKDGDYDANPTCGWAKASGANGAAQNIPGSQGFCCMCSDGAGTTTLIRGNLDCSLWETLFDSKGTAHCLRYDDWWWFAGYRIGAYQMDFQISLNLTTATFQTPANTTSNSITPSSGSPAVSSSQEVLQLTPSRPLALSTNRSVSAKLLGDLEAYSQVPQLMNQYVMVPAPPDRAPGLNVYSNKAEWLVVDGSRITLDGSECNKIGVGYMAFRSQANRCSVVQQTCLASQLIDLQKTDLDRISKGLDPLYLITRYGTGEDNPRQAEYAKSSSGAVQLSLNLPVASIKTSLVTLSVRADDLTFTTNRSPARIVGTQVCTFDGVVCGGFQAMATRGYLTASVQNTGSLPADYTVSVLSCTMGVMPVLAQFSSIAAGEARNFTFELQMESDQRIANASCVVSVADVVGEVVDASPVTFYANATEYEPPPDQSDIDDDLTGPGDTPSFSSCADLCPNLMDMVCTAKHGCWGRLSGALGALSSVPIVLLVLWVAFRRGWLLALVKALGRRPQPNKAVAAGGEEDGEAGKGGREAAGAGGGKDAGKTGGGEGGGDVVVGIKKGWKGGKHGKSEATGVAGPPALGDPAQVASVDGLRSHWQAKEKPASSAGSRAKSYTFYMATNPLADQEGEEAEQGALPVLMRVQVPDEGARPSEQYTTGAAEAAGRAAQQGVAWQGGWPACSGPLGQGMGAHHLHPNRTPTVGEGKLGLPHTPPHPQLQQLPPHGNLPLHAHDSPAPLGSTTSLDALLPGSPDAPRSDAHGRRPGSRCATAAGQPRLRSQGLPLSTATSDAQVQQCHSHHHHKQQQPSLVEGPVQAAAAAPGSKGAAASGQSVADERLHNWLLHQQRLPVRSPPLSREGGMQVGAPRLQPQRPGDSPAASPYGRQCGDQRAGCAARHSQHTGVARNAGTLGPRREGARAHAGALQQRPSGMPAAATCQPPQHSTLRAATAGPPAPSAWHPSSGGTTEGGHIVPLPKGPSQHLTQDEVWERIQEAKQQQQ